MNKSKFLSDSPIKPGAKDGIFLQLEGYQVDYDKISGTTSDDTKVTVDADDQVLQVTIGTTF